MTKPTKRQTAEAIRTLAEIAEDPDTPAYLRTNAARAIVSSARRRRRKDSDDADNEDRPQVVVILPDNERDPDLWREPQEGDVVVIIRNGEPLALPAPLLALPAPADPPKPRPLTAAERQRRRRERLRVAREAARDRAA